MLPGFCPFHLIYKVGHFFFVVQDGMTVAKRHTQLFSDTNGCPVFRSDTATDGLQVQFPKGISHAGTGRFNCITVVPIGIVKDISDFHHILTVYIVFHQSGLPYQYAVLFQYQCIITDAVFPVTGELTVYPLAYFLLVKPCSHAYMTSGLFIISKRRSKSFRVSFRIVSRSVSMIISDSA